MVNNFIPSYVFMYIIYYFLYSNYYLIYPFLCVFNVGFLGRDTDTSFCLFCVDDLHAYAQKIFHNIISIMTLFFLSCMNAKNVAFFSLQVHDPYPDHIIVIAE